MMLSPRPTFVPQLANEQILLLDVLLQSSAPLRRVFGIEPLLLSLRGPFFVLFQQSSCRVVLVLIVTDGSLELSILFCGRMNNVTLIS